MRGASWSFVLVIGLFAGCTSAPATIQSATPSPREPAAAPTADAETGSISGSVTDDELKPIAGARIGVLELQLTTASDASGRFTFNGVRPGSYRVIAEALGFSSVARKVDVKPDEVTNVSFSLAPIAVAAEPYYLPIRKTAFITFDQQWVSYVVNVLLHVNHSAICGTCIFTLRFDEHPLQIVTENTWTQTGVPSYNDGTALWFNWTSPSPNFHNNYYCYRQQRNWTATHMDSINKANVKAMMVTVQGMYFSVSFQHRIDMWNTFAYLAPLPEEYTAIVDPPTSQAVSTC